MPGGRSPVRTALIGLLAVTALIAVPVSQAHKRTFPASMAAEAKNKNLFSGKVTAPQRCLVNRSVSVFNAAGVVQGTGVTDATGAWQVKPAADIASGPYYAVMKPRRLLKNRAHRHICRGVRTDFNATL